MPVVNANDMLLQATEGKYAVGAFNCTNIIQMEPSWTRPRKKAPLIIQCSVAPSQFLKPRVVAAIYRTLAEEAPIPICLHLDHCTDVAFCKTCADAGYTNIMIDASKQPFETTCAPDRRWSDYCHSVGDIYR